MPRLSLIIAESWNFFFRQSALWKAGAWLLFLPLLAMELVPLPHDGMQPEMLALFVAVQILLVVLLLWGVACILNIGKRLLQAKAGRTRTSFATVRTQAGSLIVPLLLTDILRYCTTFFFGLPLVLLVLYVAMQGDAASHASVLLEQMPWVVPVAILCAIAPVIYLLQTTLSPMIIAYEKLAFRPALKRSRTLLKGKLVGFVLLLIALTIVFFGPSMLVSVLVAVTFPTALYAIAIVDSLLGAFTSILWTLSLTIVYREINDKRGVVEN